MDCESENKATERVSTGTIPIPPNKDFVIEVTDEQRRFQPFQFTASLPAEGIFKWDVALDSPLSARTTVPLFSAPARSVASGMAAIRADLWDTSLDAPAAWAVIEAFTAGKFLGRGIADEAGRIAVDLFFSNAALVRAIVAAGITVGFSTSGNESAVDRAGVAFGIARVLHAGSSGRIAAGFRRTRTTITRSQIHFIAAGRNVMGRCGANRNIAANGLAIWSRADLEIQTITVVTAFATYANA